MLPIIQIIIAFLIGLILVFYSVPVIVQVSKEKKLFDVPNERKVNKTVIPNLGGIALFFGITIATILAMHNIVFPSLRYILAGMIVLFFIGIKDDILIIPAHKKLYAQIISALILIIPGDIRFTHLHGIFGINEINYVFSFIISLLVIVALINALNLMDGIDGLAASIGILSTALFGAIFYNTEHFNYAILCYAIAGSLSSFFFYNVFGKKNKIFMGDTGSLLLGFLIAVFTIKYNEFSISPNKEILNFSPVLSYAIISIPIFDMVWLFIGRILQKKSPFAPDMNHIHHKLLKLGFSHLVSTLILVALNLIFILSAYALYSVNNNAVLAILIIMAIFFAFLPKIFYEYIKSKNSPAKRHQFRLVFMPLKKYFNHEKHSEKNPINANNKKK